MGREAADAGVFPGADGIFDSGMDPVGGVNGGVLPAPAFRRLAGWRFLVTLYYSFQDWNLLSSRARIVLLDDQGYSVAAQI